LGVCRSTLVRLCYGLLIGVLLAFCFHVQTLLYINDDDTYYLFTAERLLQGGSFLNVVHDTNPPLINFIYMPPVLVARLFAIPLFLVFIGYIYVLIASSLVMIWKLVPLHPDENPHFSHAAFVLFAFFLAVMPAHDFAEREHLVSILCAPWMCLVARRWSGTDTSLKASIACTTFAAIAFALKPYFLPLPLAVFIVDMLRDRSRRRAFSAENLTFAFWGLCYLGALYLLPLRSTLARHSRHDAFLQPAGGLVHRHMPARGAHSSVARAGNDHRMGGCGFNHQSDRAKQDVHLSLRAVTN
jgi:hypothetical protein